MTDPERERKRGRLAALYSTWMNSSPRSAHSMIEFFLDNGVTVELPTEPPGTNGQTGTATVQVDETTYACRGIWAGEPDDMWFFYASNDKAVSGTALPEQVTDFVPDILLTKESYNELRKYAKDAYDARAGIDGDAIRLQDADYWAREQGLTL